jgi:hypothetical protein
MRPVPYSDVDADRWNACCDASAQAWLHHRAEWIGIEADHFFPDNQSFAIVARDQVVAVQPLYFMQLGLGTWAERLLHSGLHRHTGLALLPTLEAADINRIRSLAMERIGVIAASLDVDRIQLNVQNLAPESLTADRQEIPFWMHGRGFNLGLRFGPDGIMPTPGVSSCCADQIVPLGASEESLLANLTADRRWAVRKALSAGLDGIVVTDVTQETIDRYYRLAQVSAERTGEALAPKAYFERLREVLSPQGRLAILFVKHSGQDVAAVLLVMEKDAVSYAGGISDTAFLRHQVNEFAQWEVIRWARSAGLKWYRLGPIFPEAKSDWPIARVSHFKGGFGGRSFSIIQGSKFLRPEKYLAGIADAVASTEAG